MFLSSFFVHFPSKINQFIFLDFPGSICTPFDWICSHADASLQQKINIYSYVLLGGAEYQKHTETHTPNIHKVEKMSEA